MTKKSTRALALTMLMLSLSSVAITPADARRGGSFGSRGSRTYTAPRQTENSPRYVAPVDRSMTPRTATQQAPGYNPGFSQNQAARPGSRFGGFAGGLLGGLVAGGLIGHFLGGGWGAGGGGMLAALLQIALIGGVLWLVIGFIRRRRQQPQLQPQAVPNAREAFAGYTPQAPSPGTGPWGSAVPPSQSQPVADQGIDIPVTPDDQRDFERLLIDVQDAFGREDYTRLRQLTTPEIMSYLSEELSQNATHGLRNEVTGTRLLDAEVSEAWREADSDYATIAMRYESRDVMRDRTTGAIAEGSQDRVTETLEYWTFVRGTDGVWKLSAIQEA